MATRHLQRLRAQLEQEQSRDENLEPEESSDEDAEREGPQAKAFNAFDLLSDEEGALEDDGNEAGHATPQQSPVATSPVWGGSSSPSKPKKAKRKKKKKGGVASQVDAPSAADDIDAAVQALCIAPEERTQNMEASTSGTQGARPLAIESKRLKALDEVRNLFGKEVMALEREAQRESRGSERGATRSNPHGRIRRQLVISSHSDTRKPYDGILNMVSLGPSEDGSGTNYQYVGSNAYRTAQLLFEQAQTTMDPNEIVDVLRQYPFHVESLLAMVDVYQVTDQQDTANYVLEDALYAIEAPWQPTFKSHLLAGTARLPIKLDGNAIFYQVCLRYIQVLSRRGCNRTALEWCKMLLSLDHDDPMGVLFHMDYFALRSAEYDFLHELVDSFTGDQSLRLLPNFAFSCALADYYKFRTHQQAAGEAAASATGVHGRDANPTLDAKLANAILTFPVTVARLLEVLQEQGVAQDAAWASVLQRKLFKRAHCSHSKTLTHLSNIFVMRSALLWKSADVLAWLLRCCQDAADIADGAKEVEQDSLALSYADAAALCSVSYDEADENEYQHCLVHNYSDSATHLPADQLAAAIGHDREVAPDGAPQAGQQGPNISREELRRGNPLMMFLRTLLPWVNADAGRDAGHAAAEPAAQPAAPAERPAANVEEFIRQGMGEDVDVNNLNADERALLDEMWRNYQEHQGGQRR